MKKEKIIFITSVLISLMALVSFSTDKNNFKITREISNGKDTVKTNPKIDINVKKEYDDDGNIIRYDSSYTYIYTHSNGKKEELNIDSIVDRFEPYFFHHGFDIMNDPFHDFFESDTLYQRHFFDDDFFMQQFENEMFHFEEMIRQMDSLRNQFLKENYPDLKHPKTKPKKEKTKAIEI